MPLYLSYSILTTNIKIFHSPTESCFCSFGNCNRRVRHHNRQTHVSDRQILRESKDDSSSNQTPLRRYDLVFFKPLIPLNSSSAKFSRLLCSKPSYQWQIFDAQLLLNEKTEQKKWNSLKTDSTNEDDGKSDPPPPAGFLAQCYLLYKRQLLSLKRDYFLLVVRLLCHLLIGIIFGYLYMGSGYRANGVLANYVYLYGSLLLIVYTGKMAVTLACKCIYTILFWVWWEGVAYFGTRPLKRTVLSELPILRFLDLLVVEPLKNAPWKFQVDLMIFKEDTRLRDSRHHWETVLWRSGNFERVFVSKRYFSNRWPRFFRHFFKTWKSSTWSKDFSLRRTFFYIYKKISIFPRFFLKN